MTGLQSMYEVCRIVWVLRASPSNEIDCWVNSERILIRDDVLANFDM